MPATGYPDDIAPPARVWLRKTPSGAAVRDPGKTVNDYIRIYNKNPGAFQRAASASRIIRKSRKYEDNKDTSDAPVSLDTVQHVL